MLSANDESPDYKTTDATFFQNTSKIPLINLVQAGEWNDSVDIYEPGYADTWIETINQNNGNCFALEIEGDSMTAPLGETPTYPDEFIIHVNPHKQYENKSFIIAKQTETEKVTFKQLRYDEGRPYLHALNPSPEYPDMFEEFIVIGVVYDCRHNPKWYK